MHSELQFRNTELDFDYKEEKKDRPLSAVHIRLQQRNARQKITFIEGLAEDLDLKKIVRCLKKTFQTNGAIVKDKKNGDKEVIQLNGDQRRVVKQFLERYKVWEEPDPPIIVHGF